jgi:hypothetical protein
MKSHEMMVTYLKLSPEERHEFDRVYARRVILLRIFSRLRRATPEQIRRVREILEKKPGWRKLGVRAEKGYGLPREAR